ncbi:MAG TPA: ABC transporter permease, partial [Gemmatimonadaceae bacterium]
MNVFVDELRAVVRSVRRSPRYFLLASACLALGIGVNAAMFAVVDALFLSPPIGVQNPQRVTRLYFNRHVPVGRIILTDLASFPTLSDLRDGAAGLRGVAGYDATVVSEGRGASATKLRAGLANESYFSVFGTRATIGRLFQAGDGSMAAPPVAVVSDGLWHSRFGGRISAVGRTLVVAGRVYTIVGVAEPGFTGVDIDPIDVWLPLEIAAGDLIMPGYQTRRGAMAISLLARLAPGVSRQAAEADATRAFRLGMRSIKSFDSTDRVIVAPLLRDRGPKESDRAKVAAWLAGVSFAVLLIACINCAALMLLRLLRREGELAVRTVLGATQATLMRLVMLENLALALFAAILATGVAVTALAIFGNLLLSRESPAAFVPVARLFGVAVAVALGVGAVTAVPVTLIFLARRVTISARLGLRRGMTRRSHAPSVSLAVQIALVTALLIGAGLFGESLYHARTLDLGFEPRDVFAANVDFPGFAARPVEGESVSQLYRDLETAVRRVPGVAAAGVTSSLPFQYLGAGMVSIPGRDLSTLPTLPVFIASTSEGYLATVGLRLKAGRWFTAADNAS